MTVPHRAPVPPEDRPTGPVPPYLNHRSSPWAGSRVRRALRRGARALRAVSVAILLVACCPPAAAADRPDPPGVTRDNSKDKGAVDRWHEERGYYGIEDVPQEKETLRFALYPGLGVQVGTPEVLVGLGEVFISISDARSFSVFGGVGVEGRENVDAAVFTLGWGGVRRVQVAGRQSGFFGAFLRYRRYSDRKDTSQRKSFSLGSEVGGGHLSMALEFGGVQDRNDDWGVLIRLAIKAVWSIPLAS